MSDETRTEEPQTEARLFTLAQVLSVTTDVLVCPVGKVYEILNFLTADNLFTHQLLRASRECTPYLLEKFPELRNVDASNVTPENWAEWLAKQIDLFGSPLLVEAMPDGRHEYREPVAELGEMVGPERVVVVPIQEAEHG